MTNRASLPVLRLLKPLPRVGVVHCFSGDLQIAQASVKLGIHKGIGRVPLQEWEGGRDPVRDHETRSLQPHADEDRMTLWNHR